MYDLRHHICACLHAGWPTRGPVAIAGSAALTALVVCAVLAAVRAEANAGPPIYIDGQIAAEPSGLEGIAISHETLNIDMRRLPNPIDVSVTYSVTNRGPAREVALLFASGASDTAGFSAMLDGQPIAAQPAISVTVPAEWMPPATTPGLDGVDLLYLNPPRNTYAGKVDPYGIFLEKGKRSTTSTYVFTVTIPTNESILSVHYYAEPQQYQSGGYVSSINSYQFAYVLAPARAWDSFGGLDATVSLPACWLAASRPELARSGDELRGSFESIPADALAFTVAPCQAARRQTVRPCPAFGLILPLGALGIVLHHRTRRSVQAGNPEAPDSGHC
jgi:hypothetical protein